MDPKTQGLLIRVGIYGVLGYLAWKYLAPLGERVKETLDTIGQGVADKLYEWTHADFAKANFIDGVALPDGRVINLVKSQVNASMLFPFQGSLYKLKRDAAGKPLAILAPVGSRYDYPEFYVIARSGGGVTVTQKTGVQ